MKSIRMNLLVIAVLMSMLLVGNVTAVTLTPIADSTLAQAYPTGNYSGEPELQVENYANVNEYNRHSLIKFDIAGSGLTVGDVVDVKLRLFWKATTVQGGGDNDYVMQVKENTIGFDEGASYPTWSTHSTAYGSTVYGTLQTPGYVNGGPLEGSWWEVDIDPALVIGWVDGSITNNGLFLYGDGYWRSLQPMWASSNYANGTLAPELVIVPEPATLMLLSVGVFGLLKRKK